MGSRRPFTKSLVQNERNKERQEEKTQRVNNEDESLVRKQMPTPEQNEDEKAPREDQRPENAVSGDCDRTCNENEGEKDTGKRPERTNQSQWIKKKDVSQERD
jgi:hypothetical protein